MWGVKKVGDEVMNDKEMISVLIDKYTDLQRIKATLKEDNKEVNYQIKTVKAKLEAFGVVVEDLNID